MTDEQAAGLPPGLRDINQVFCAADWLAIRFQKRVMTALRVTHVCALLTGLAYVSYADLRCACSCCPGRAARWCGVGSLANHGSWHRKYLDYRTLAEGLRVQFFWAAAGVTSGNVTKFAHDNFLQMQDADLGWIRNVMRVAGPLRRRAEPRSGGLEFAFGSGSATTTAASSATTAARARAAGPAPDD